MDSEASCKVAAAESVLETEPQNLRRNGPMKPLDPQGLGHTSTPELAEQQGPVSSPSCVDKASRMPRVSEPGEEINAALTELDVGAQREWDSIPPELLEMIGYSLSDGRELSNASLVCKSWRMALPSGVDSLELDMHPDPQRWQTKMNYLRSMLQRLTSATIHVNTRVPGMLLKQNLQLLGQLKSVQELHLRFADSVELPADACAAIGELSQLETFTLVGGQIAPGGALRLLVGLSRSGRLKRLTMLPAVRSGLGDEEMAVVGSMHTLEVVEFRAHRLTSAGIELLSALPGVQKLAICSLDSDSGYELACLERMSNLQDLNLELDHVLPTRPLCQLSPVGSLALHFRWTDRAAGLLQACRSQLVNLTQLDMGACRVSSEAVFEAVAELTGLVELRMSMYSNADHCIECRLSQLTNLQRLQGFHLIKQHAYFPESRRIAESSIAVPVTASAIHSLAARWSHLQSLRLALSRQDYSRSGLEALAGFSSLKTLALSVESFAPGPASSTSASSTVPVASFSMPAASSSVPAPSFDTSAASSSSVPVAARSNSSNNSGDGFSLQTEGDPAVHKSRRSSGEFGWAVVNVMCLPPRLQCLELNNVYLDMPLDKFGSSPHLSCLEALDIENCHVRTSQLSALAAKVCGSLHSLRLANVVGLTNDGIAALSALTGLQSLAVFAPRNSSVTQQSLHQLRPLRGLKSLTWESDDLSGLGPEPDAFSTFTQLRLLSLSCTKRTLVHACGGPEALLQHLPYCYLDLVHSSNQYEDAEAGNAQ